MSKLIALIFNEGEQQRLVVGPGGIQTRMPDSGPERAESVLAAAEKAAKEAGVNIQDAAILFKTRQGEFKIKQSKQVTPGKGARRGSFWGLIAGLILGGPLAGLIWGLGIGALYGKVVDHGINDQFLKEIADSLTPRTSAIIVLIDDEVYPQAIGFFKTFETEILTADFDEETQKAVMAASENEEIANVVEEKFGGE